MTLRHAPEIPGVELGDVIGAGGAGIVYRARQVAFDRLVAVKVSAADGSDGETRRRWEREVAAVGRLSNHPNVVPVFDAGIADGAAYIVMALAPGGSLGDRLRAEGPLPPAEVAQIGIKLAGALSAVHAAGVLHRDIKPDNVLWTPHGEPQLTDFGIARLADRTATMDSSVRATVSYAAPEVLRGEEATEATDVYGLGATLYACLTGAAPHASAPDEHVAAAVARALQEDPAPLTDAGVPAALARVVEQAIARDPAARQRDAARLRHNLERAAAGLDGNVAETALDATGVLPRTAIGTAIGTAVSAPVDPAPTRPRRPTIAAPAPPPPSSPARPMPAPPPDRRGGRTLWLAVLGVVVLVVGLLVVQSLTADDGGDVDTASPVPEATAPPATEPPAEEAPPEQAAPDEGAVDEEEPAATTTPEPSTTQDEDPTPEPSRSDAGDGPTEAALTYLETLDADRLDEAWQMTTSRFQARQDRRQWEQFWGGHQIDVVGEPQVSDRGTTVIVPLTYDGQREDYRLTLAEQGGRWLIDGPVGG